MKKTTEKKELKKEFIFLYQKSIFLILDSVNNTLIRKKMRKTLMIIFLVSAVPTTPMEKHSLVTLSEQKVTIKNPLIQFALSYHATKTSQLINFQKKIFNDATHIGAALILTSICAYWNPRYTSVFAPALFFSFLHRLTQKDSEIANPSGKIAHNYFKHMQKVARAKH